jgi:hypothetical protein
MSEKVLGTNDGIENEKNLINAINGKRLCEIPSDPQVFYEIQKKQLRMKQNL